MDHSPWVWALPPTATGGFPLRMPSSWALSPGASSPVARNPETQSVLTSRLAGRASANKQSPSEVQPLIRGNERAHLPIV